MTVETRVSAAFQQVGQDVGNLQDRATAIETKTNQISVTQPVNLDTMESRLNELDAAVVLKGSWDPGGGTFPGGGNAQAGDSYIVSAGGTVDGVVFSTNDRIVAISDGADDSVYAGNWVKMDYSDQVSSVNGQTGAVTGLANLATHIGDPEANFLNVYTSARDA